MSVDPNVSTRLSPADIEKNRGFVTIDIARLGPDPDVTSAKIPVFAIGGTLSASGVYTPGFSGGGGGGGVVTQPDPTMLNAQVVGNVASGTADAGNPVKVGGIFNTANPTLANGQRGDLQLTSRGLLQTGISSADGLQTAMVTNSGDGMSVGTQRLVTTSIGYLYDGTSFFRARGDATGGGWVQGSVASGTADAGNPLKFGGVFNTTPPTVTTGQRVDAQYTARGEQRVALSTGGVLIPGDATGLGTYRVPSALAAAGIVPVVAQGVFSLVVKASAGNFVGGYMIAGAAAGFLIAYNATTAPAAGAAITPALVLGVVPVAASAPAALGDYNVPDRFGTGIVLLFSTSITLMTNPANPAVFIRGKAS